MSKYTILLFLIQLLVSCTTDKTIEQKDENLESNLAYKDGNVSLTASQTEQHKGLLITNFVADTGVNKTEEVLSTNFSIDVSQQIINQVQKEGFDALIVNILCKGKAGKEFSYLTTYLPELSGMVVYPDKHIVFTHPSTRSIQIDIPFRKLELETGLQALNLSVCIYPIKFAADTNRVETKHIERIGSNPLYRQSYTARVHTPTLKQNIISITDLKINTGKKKASSYDFTLIGSGLPDPYWQIWCGQELIYFSPATTNSLTIKGTEASNSFYTSAKDIITIKFLDYDNGPFNRDDLIEMVEGTTTDFLKMKCFNGHTISVKSLKVEQQLNIKK